MNHYQEQCCFVCDKEVVNSGIHLSVDKTYFTKTSFPTKISQLIGDEFMVVVSEDDKLCGGCASLINKLDKLEVDLTKTKQTITSLLNIKYKLNYVDYANSLEGIKHTDDKKHQDFNLKTNSRSPCDFTGSREDFSDAKVANSQPSNASKHSIDCMNNTLKDNFYIKTEPTNIKNSNTCLDDSFDVRLKKELNSQFVPEVSFKELSANHSIQERKSPITCERELNSSSPQLLQDEILNKMKKEKCTYDCSLNNPLVSIQNNTDNKFHRLKLDNEQLVLKLTPPTVKNDETGIIPTEIKQNPMKRSVKKIKPLRSHLKIDHRKNSVRRIRPILPKITQFSDVLFVKSLINSSLETKIKPTLNSNNYKVKSKGAHESVRLNVQQDRTKVKERNINPSLEEGNTSKKKESQHKANLSFNCKLCKLSFTNLELLKNHKKEHSVIGNLFKCTFCQRIFKTRTGLQNHVAVHTGSFSFCCDFCGHGFTSRGALEEHRSSHTKEERFVCDVCGKKFIFKSTYWIHRKWHDNPYPYKCNDCGRQFKHTSLLSNHKRKHTGERPYKCSFCSLTFTVSNSLKRHLILHTKKYPFNCNICKHGFTTRFKYTEHLAKSHDIVVNKPSVEKKDYKVAVYDNVIENNTLQNLVNSMEAEFNRKDTDSTINSFSDEISESFVEIVLGPSPMLCDPSLSLSEEWLV